MNQQDIAIGAATRLVSEAWEVCRTAAFNSVRTEGRLDAMPDLSRDATRKMSEVAQAIADRIDAIDAWSLPETLSVPLRQARYAMAVRRHAGDWYDTVFDPCGVGFYGLFAPSAYCGGQVLQLLVDCLKRHQEFVRASDLDRYLAAMSDFGDCIDQMAERTSTQAKAGMRIPKVQLPSARAIIAGFKARLGELVPKGKGQAEVAARVRDQVEPAFDRWAAILNADYEAKAPEGVGMGQYERGAEIYRELVRLHTTMDLDVREIHEIGLERISRIKEQMRKIRSQVGLADDPKAYLARAFADPRFSATTVEGVGAVFQRYIDRMERVFSSAFREPPKVEYGAMPLPKALEGSMTFGFYSPARPGQPKGYFNFNSDRLTKVPLLNIGALTYHELVPGHHLHLASQNGNETLLPISRHAFCNAYNEGWAEYAATLAGEMGMYEAPEEQYGRCIMDAFLSCRLVVDTGMNALGWSLEHAREFMRENSFMSEAEIRSESLRYSCDFPAQALAYKLGDTELMKAREASRAKLGENFDLREFHARVLAYGAMPLPELHRYLNG